MPKKRKSVGAVKKRKAVKRKTRARAKPVHHAAAPVKRRRQSTATRVKKRVYKARRVRVKAYKAVRYRRVGGTGMDKMMPLLVIGGLGLLAYMAFKKNTATTVPPLQLTSNTVRDSSAQNLLAYAQAAGLGIDAISRLINSLNSMSDAAVVSAAQQPDLSINTLAALPTGGPSIHLGS